MTAWSPPEEIDTRARTIIRAAWTKEIAVRRRRTQPVPVRLVADIESALLRVRESESALQDTVADRGSRLERRRRHRELRAAYLAADGLLREATRLAKPHSYLAWSHWRHQLSQLDLARQTHLFREQDDSGVLGLGDVRAVDTGMAGPAIGDLLHGRSRPPGTAPRYGLDLEAVLAATDGVRPARQRSGTAIRPDRPAAEPVTASTVLEAVPQHDEAAVVESSGDPARTSSTAAA